MQLSCVYGLYLFVDSPPPIGDARLFYAQRRASLFMAAAIYVVLVLLKERAQI